MWVAFANASICTIFNGQSFNDTLTNNIVSFEQLSPDVFGKKFAQYLLTAQRT